MVICKMKSAVFSALAAVAASFQAGAAGTEAAVLRTVNDRLAREFISHDGLLLDYVGEIPTPEEIADLKPNAMGWWCPIENGSMFTGEWLPALMAEGPSRKTLVERCVKGLIKMSEISDVPGFIARGTGTDGKSHHPCGSNDQTDPWFLGLCEYCRWPHADAALKAKVLERVVFVAKALEKNGWQVPCDGPFRGQNRGKLNGKGMPFWCVTRFLYLLQSLSELTGDAHWADLYAQTKKERLCEIECGAEIDARKFKAAYGNCVWIYVSSAQALAGLIAREKDPADRERMKKGLSNYAAHVAPLMKDRAKYENTTERPFKYANWRTGYAWREQKTQKDAEAVAHSGKREILGTRKDYERNGMANPLAAAAVCALSGETKFREEVVAMLHHYDYSTPNISEFFHAAIAAAALALTADAVNEVNTTAGIAVDVKAMSEGVILIDERVEKGPVKIVNGVNGCPVGEEAIAAWKAAEIPFARTHDLNLAHAYGAPYVIDVPWIFRDFEADENDPKSYDFACTDALLARIRDTGCEPFYRLGGAYETKLVKKYNIFPPQDFDKWARICEHIIAHYNEGWADGFKWNIRYWEIWNEPDLRTGSDDGAKGTFWRGPRSEFVRLFKTTLRHLKAKYPHLKFGGPAVSSVGAWDEQYLSELAAEQVPLDFFSWHGYSTDPQGYIANAKRVRALLDKNGYVKTASINDEWNYVKGWDPWTRAYSMEVEKGRFNQKGAAFLAAAFCCWQLAPVDMTMYYDARQPGMNALFDPVTGLPMRGYYPFLIWKDLRRLGMQIEAKTKLKNIYVTAAKNKEGCLGVFIVRYTDDNNVVRPTRVTVRLASGRSLAAARLHLTDDVRIHTATYFEANADGSIDLILRPCSFAFLELGAKDFAGTSSVSANPLFEGWYADPQIRRFGGTYWIFPTYSHDFKEQTFMDAFSSNDLKTWIKHPKAMDIKDVSWARGALWAPDAHENGGRYYIFFSANNAYPAGGKRTDGELQSEPGIGKYGGIGVAVADCPEGPYRDLIGKPLVDRFWNAAQPIDQYVFRYKDDWYMVYGGWGRCNLVKLASDFKSLVPFGDGRMWKDLTPPGYKEGSVVFERKGKWYFMYSSGGWTTDNYCVNYCVADTPFGPFEFKGRVLGSQRPLATGAGHHSVVCVPGTDEWYICYHRRPIPNESPHHRVVCLDRLYFEPDGSIRPVVMTGSAEDKRSVME